MNVLELLEENPIIAAVRNESEFEAALASSPTVVFLLAANILTLETQITQAHQHKKAVLVHADLAEGLGKDATGIEFLKRLGTDGVISTRSAVIRMARDCGLSTVQRFFMVDSHSVRTAAEAIRTAGPDMVELMPGVVPKIVQMVAENCAVPVIAGGLIDTKEEIMAALSAGAAAVSTGCRTLWNK